MTLYFANRSMTILGMASTDLPNGLRIFDDAKTEQIDSGSVTLEFTVYYTPETRKTVSEYVSAGNYILYKDGTEQGFFTIIDYEEDVLNRSIKIYAEDNGMDLLNETLYAYEADKAYSAAYYIEKFAYDSGFTINVNEVSDKTLQLQWGSVQTASERIQSVADEFGAELSYSFEIKNMGIAHKYINLYKQRGSDNGIQLRFGDEIDNITVTKSVADLATGLSVTGGTPDGSNTAISLEGYSYDDGDFYVSGNKLLSRVALSKWTRYLHETGDDGGHIIQRWSYDTTDQATLFNKALEHLKEICEVSVTCEVDLLKFPSGAKIGDTMYIVEDSGELYMSARLLKLVTSRANDKYTATFGDYVQQDSGISSKVQELANQFAELAKRRVLYTWIAYADDETGTNISKVAFGKKYMGIAYNRISETIDISDPSIYEWSKIAGDDGRSIVSITEYYQINNSSTTIPTSWSTSVLSPTADKRYLWNYEVYTYTDGSKAETKERVIGVYGDTGTSISDIINYYLASTQSEGITIKTEGWTKTVQAMDQGKRYLWNYEEVIGDSGAVISTSTPHMIGVYGAKGEEGFSPIVETNKSDKTTTITIIDAEGRKNAVIEDGIDGESPTLVSTVISYAQSSGGTVAPTSGWQTSPPTATQGMFMWTRIVQTFSDGKTSTSYSVAYNGTNGVKGDDGTMIYAICNTAAGTAAKVAQTQNGTFVLKKGVTVTVSFTYANTAAKPTLNINSTGAKEIRLVGNNSLYWNAGACITFTYDGSYYRVSSEPVYASEAIIGNASGYNIQLTGSKMNIRNGSKELATYDGQNIYLGKTGQSGSGGTFNLFNGTFTIVSQAGTAGAKNFVSGASDICLRVMDHSSFISMFTNLMYIQSGYIDIRSSSDDIRIYSASKLSLLEGGRDIRAWKYLGCTYPDISPTTIGIDIGAYREYLVTTGINTYNSSDSSWYYRTLASTLIPATEFYSQANRDWNEGAHQVMRSDGYKGGVSYLNWTAKLYSTKGETRLYGR